IEQSSHLFQNTSKQADNYFFLQQLDKDDLLSNDLSEIINLHRQLYNENLYRNISKKIFFRFIQKLKNYKIRLLGKQSRSFSVLEGNRRFFHRSKKRIFMQNSMFLRRREINESYKPR